MSISHSNTAARGREPSRTADRIYAGLAAIQGVAGGALLVAALLALALMLSGCTSVPPPRAAGQATPRAAQAAPQPRQAQAVDPAVAAAQRAQAAAIVGALAQIAGGFAGGSSPPAYAPPAYVAPPQYAPPPVFSLSEPQAPQPSVWRPRGFEHLNH